MTLACSAVRLEGWAAEKNDKWKGSPVSSPVLGSTDANVRGIQASETFEDRGAVYASIAKSAALLLQ